jgi:hypothetical protein
MAYKPKIVTGMVTGTGWPIDGHVLYFSQWDYDQHQSFHLYGWDDEDDEAVMLTMYQNETIGTSLKEFTEKWKAKEWEPPGSFCLPLDNVEVQEVKQEEEKDDTRKKLLAHGIDLSPRKDTDRGGILCLPLAENLNGDVRKKHPDWESMDCPHCGRKCWKPAGVDKLQQEQGVQLLCTKCALEAGLVRPYRPDNTPNPAGNRAQRRRAERERKKR